MTSSGLPNATQSRDGSRYASATDPFFVCLSCSRYISSSSFVVVETRPELARRAEQVLSIVVCGHQERSIGARAFPSARERADNHKVDRIAQRGAVFLLELDPLVPPRARVVRRVQGLRHEAFASRLKGLVEECLGLFHVVCYADCLVAGSFRRFYDRLEGLASFRVRPSCEVLLTPQEAVERG